MNPIKARVVRITQYEDTPGMHHVMLLMYQVGITVEVPWTDMYVPPMGEVLEISFRTASVEI